MLRTGAVILFYTFVFMVGCTFAGYGVAHNFDPVFVAGLFLLGAVGTMVVSSLSLIALIMIVESVEKIGEK